MTETEASQRQLGDIANELLFENERVRVWKLELGPGKDSPPHRHDLDHVLIVLSGDRVAVVPEPDTKGEYNEYLEVDVFPGKSLFVGRGGIERARNVGKETFHEIIVELKD